MYAPPTSKQKKKNTPQSSCPDEKADSEAGSEPNSPTITIGPGDKIVFMPYHLNKQVEATITSIAESSQHDEQLDVWTTQGLFDRTISDTLVLVHSNYTPNIRVVSFLPLLTSHSSNVCRPWKQC